MLSSVALHYNSPAPELWERNCVLSGRTPGHVTGIHKGTLSIKWMLKGSARWSTPGRSFQVSPQSYLVLNRGQEYLLETPRSSPNQTFAVFFRPGYIEDFFDARTAGVEQLFEEPNSSELNFFERLNPSSDEVGRALATLSRTLRELGPSSDDADEAFAALGTALLHSQDLALGESESLGKAKAAVRDEVFRRLNAARDAVLSEPEGDHSLQKLAGIATLAPNYFHELFRRAYGEPPHRFVTRARLGHARQLLLTSDAALEEIATAAGFQNASSFCHTFKRHFAVTPGSLRDKN